MYCLLAVLGAVYFREGRSDSDILGMMAGSFMYGLAGTPVIAELWNLYDNGFIMDLEASQRVDEELENYSKKTTHRFDELECKICVRNYDEEKLKRTPRILKECGHSLCLGCVETLMKKKDLVIIT